jgi:MFS transporter, UMF1 family
MAELGKPGIPKRGIYGWMMFDWAAQPFFTLVTTFIFGPYFVSRLSDDPVHGQAMWSYAAAFAGLMIAILSPVLGSIADQTGPRKPWIGFFAAIKITCLALLWYAAPGSSLLYAAVLFSIASIAAEFSIVFNDSMMPRLVSKEAVGRVSNIAWGLGYLGGMLLLIFTVVFLTAPPETGKTLLGSTPLFGLDPKQAEADRAAGPMSALWYFVFILPMFFFTPDTGKGAPLGLAVREGIAELKETLREARQRPGIFRFLISRMIYQDGVNGILLLGGTFAAAMFGWVTMEIGIYGIILNVVAIIGCLVASKLDGVFGSKRIVIISIFLLILATLGIVSTGVKPTAQIVFDQQKLTQANLDQNTVMTKLGELDVPSVLQQEPKKLILYEATRMIADGIFEVQLNKIAIDKLENAIIADERTPVHLSEIAELRQGGYTLFGLLNFEPSNVKGVFSTPAEMAYILYGFLIGLAFGPVQASSRSYMARSVSEEEAGRYFGIYALSGRATSFLAPFTVATVTTLSGSSTLGMAMLLAFFIVGLAILWRTPYPAAVVKD